MDDPVRPVAVDMDTVLAEHQLPPHQAQPHNHAQACHDLSAFVAGGLHQL